MKQEEIKEEIREAVKNPNLIHELETTPEHNRATLTINYGGIVSQTPSTVIDKVKTLNGRTRVTFVVTQEPLESSQE
jgi:hypothetical protein